MNYIVHKRFKGLALCGEVNLPYGTELQEQDSMILHGGRPLCRTTSQNAYDHFARNDDGQGLERGKLTTSITNALAKRDKNHQARWDKVWTDPLCQKFKRADHADYWLWNHDFFNAELSDLRYIASLVGATIS